MRFIIENITKSGRIGHLMQGGDSAVKFQTPMLLQTTKSGSIPFLTPDTFKTVTKEEPQILQLSMDTMVHMTESLALYKQGVSSYVGLGGYPTMLAIRDPNELMPNGFNEKDTVPLFTRKGKEPITVQRYMEVVETFAPTIYQGMSDADTNYDSPNKRIQKSVDRTNKFMDYCYERHRATPSLHHTGLYVPIVGGYNKHNRLQSIQHANGQQGADIAGYILEGFHSYGTSATAVPIAKVVEIVRHCLDHLDGQKPRLMMGAFTPVAALQLVQTGVDMFDTSYAYYAAVNFKALTFKFADDREQMKANETPFLDLTADSMKEDFTPFLSDCTCLSCTKHTRAYAHHLYKTNEMLGSILLMIHNLHHYMEYFRTIRAAVAADNLAELLQLVQYQGAPTDIDYAIDEAEPIPREQRIA